MLILYIETRKVAFGIQDGEKILSHGAHLWELASRFSSHKKKKANSVRELSSKQNDINTLRTFVLKDYAVQHNHVTLGKFNVTA